MGEEEMVGVPHWSGSGWWERVIQTGTPIHTETLDDQCVCCLFLEGAKPFKLND